MTNDLICYILLGRVGKLWIELTNIKNKNDRKARFFMDQLMEILTEVNADVDFENCDTLVDDGILDSFDIVSIVGS